MQVGGFSGVGDGWWVDKEGGDCRNSLDILLGFVGVVAKRR